MSPKGPDSYCYNCYHPIQEGDIYCANCGQKHHTGKYKLGKFVADFFYTNFNLDNRFFRSLAGLSRPGFLTNQYFKGKHKRYNTPIQVFLILAVIFFGLLGWIMDEGNSDGGRSQLLELIAEREMKEKTDALLDSVAFQTNDEALKRHIDTLKYGYSPLVGVPDSVEEDLDQIIGIFNFNIGFKEDTLYLDEVKIAAEEVLEKSSAQIVHEYLPHYPWYKRVLARQALRMGLDTEALNKFLMSRFPLLILIVTPLFALMLKLLYIRKKFYFVEHFVFSLHLNSASLLISLIVFLLYQFCNVSYNWLVPIAMIIWALYFYKALRHYYGQSRKKTILKFILANFLGTFVGVIALVIIFLIAFLIF